MYLASGSVASHCGLLTRVLGVTQFRSGTTCDVW